jgi:hypothetical protein
MGRRWAPQTTENKGVVDFKKSFAENTSLWYSVFAFVALVSPLGSKAVARSHTCGLFFCPVYRFAVFRAKLEDGRGSVEGLGTWGIR